MGQAGKRRRFKRSRGQKKGDNGRETQDGDEGGWEFLNVPLWRMKRRKSNGQKTLQR